MNVTVVKDLSKISEKLGGICTVDNVNVPLVKYEIPLEGEFLKLYEANKLCIQCYEEYYSELAPKGELKLENIELINDGIMLRDTEDWMYGYDTAGVLGGLCTECISDLSYLLKENARFICNTCNNEYVGNSSDNICCNCK